MFDIKDPNKFLGGQNVHNLLILALLGFVVYNQMVIAKKLQEHDENREASLG